MDNTSSSVADSYRAANAVNLRCSVLESMVRRLRYFGLLTNIIRRVHQSSAQYDRIIIGRPWNVTICPGVAQLPNVSHKTALRTSCGNTSASRGRCASARASTHTVLIAWTVSVGDEPVPESEPDCVPGPLLPSCTVIGAPNGDGDGDCASFKGSPMA